MNDSVASAVRHAELPGAHLLPVELPERVAPLLAEFWAVG
jgi:hypothetical protein